VRCHGHGLPGKRPHLGQLDDLRTRGELENIMEEYDKFCPVCL